MRPMHGPWRALMGCAMLSLVAGVPAARALPNPHSAALAGGMRVSASRGIHHTAYGATSAVRTGHVAAPLTGAHYLKVEDGGCPVNSCPIKRHTWAPVFDGRAIKDVAV